MGDIGYFKLSTGTGGGAHCASCDSNRHYQVEFLHVFLIADSIALIRMEVHCRKCGFVWYAGGWEKEITFVDNTEIAPYKPPVFSGRDTEEIRIPASSAHEETNT